MGRADQPLLAQIGSEALDVRVPLTTALRKCSALGAQARNDELRDWASKELDGYRDGGLPSYDLQALVRNARAAGKTAVQMAPDGAADLVKLWNHEQRNFGGGTIMRLYWDVNVARIEGVLEQIRTTLSSAWSARCAPPCPTTRPYPPQIRQPPR